MVVVFVTAAAAAVVVVLLKHNFIQPPNIFKYSCNL
jgi:hypothetical protein